MASRADNEFKQFHVETEYFTNELAKSSFQFGKNEIADMEVLEANTLMHPLLVRLYANESWKVE